MSAYHIAAHLGVSERCRCLVNLYNSAAVRNDAARSELRWREATISKVARRRYRYRKLLERCVRKNKRFTTAVRQQALLEFNASMRTFDRKLQHHSTATTAGGTYTSNLNTLNVIQIVCQNQRAFGLEQCAINPYICSSGIAEDALNCCPGATCYMTRPEARGCPARLLMAHPSGGHVLRCFHPSSLLKAHRLKKCSGSAA